MSECIFGDVTPTSSDRDGNGGVERWTRLAPSPTGALHLGNARTFLVNFALARQHGWHVLMRIEDLDGPRVKPEASQQAIRVMEWMGMEWDAGPVFQSHEIDRYAEAMGVLVSNRSAYPCALTRTQILDALHAPHVDSREIRFPPELRPTEFPERFNDPDTGWRFVTPDEVIEFEDLFAGEQRIRVSDSVGDFVIWTKQGMPAYQLAVVVDDARQGITDVVRGDDLLDSAARQRLVYDALGFDNWPAQCHLPLVVGEDGRRLAKRHGDTRIARYMEAGIPSERVIGLMASWCGIGSEEPGARGPRREMGIHEFVERFNLGRMSQEPLTCTREDEAWLSE
ncbi:MAG: glutamate--tRNA ligase family protein [Phycisphaerales bacterium JB043]